MIEESRKVVKNTKAIQQQYSTYEYLTISTVTHATNTTNVQVFLEGY